MLQWQSRSLAPGSPDITDWIALYGECGSSPLLHPDFLLAALHEYGGPETRLISCRDGERLLAAAAIRSDGNFRLDTFQPSQAPVGFWLQRREVPTAQLLQTLTAAQPPWILAMSLTQQDPDLLNRPADSGTLLTADYIDTARITISSAWEDYWQSRGSNLRQNIRKAKNRLDKAGKHIELRTLSAEGDMAEAVQTYGEIESKSWKFSEGTAVASDNDQGRFYLDLLRRFARRGNARCYQLLVDGQIAATDLCVLGNDEIVILKTTFDEVYKDYSPAFLMREAAFPVLFAERRLKRIEFYGRVMDWHKRWTDEIRTMYHVTQFRAAVVPRLWGSLKRIRASAPGT